MTGHKASTGIDGLLNIDKPPGVTSREVVDVVGKRLGVRRAGHAGTLDPLATGVLLVCVGQATRLVEYLQQLPKTYHATFLLGAASETDDVDGQVELLCQPPVPTEEQLLAAAQRQVGTIEQVPPAYSAIHVDGRRAYARARRGESVQLDARPVTIEALTVESYDYPEVDMTITCHSGTYIRAIGRDVAAALGTAAVMKRLRRSAVGPFRDADGVSLDAPPDVFAAAIKPLVAVVPHLPQVVLTRQQILDVRHGRRLEQLDIARDTPRAAAVDSAGSLVAILESASGRWQPRKVFQPSPGKPR